MSRQSDNYIHSQLEPENVLITGNAKRWGLMELPEPRRFAEVSTPEVRLSEEESDQMQDEYLQSFGL